MSENMIDAKSITGYELKDKELLKLALTHSSYANEKGLPKTFCNERLEFLGDAVLELVISEHIYRTHTNMSEGEMTKLRARVVCEQSLVGQARAMNLGDYLLLGKGEEASGGRVRESILADAFEAVLGAVFLDGGMEQAREYALHYLGAEVSKSGTTFFDYKTQLQEIIQRNSKEALAYRLIGESGPDHEKLFVASVSHCERTLGQGEGRTKKEAEQQAAKMAIKSIQEGGA